MKNISIIVAVAKNFAIGKDNYLLWHISEDLKRFRKLTMGHMVIMGKKTFNSLPNGPLQGRTNLVITDIPNETIPGCEMAYSIKEALDKCPENDEVFIIGGGSVYRQFMPFANKLYLTFVNKDYEADTFFPEIDFNEWNEISREEHDADGPEVPGYSYLVLIRK